MPSAESIRLAVIATDDSRATLAVRRLEAMGFSCAAMRPGGSGQRRRQEPPPDVVVAVETPGAWQPARLLAERDLFGGAAGPSAGGLTAPPLLVLSEGVSPVERAEALSAPGSRIWDWVESGCPDRELAARLTRLASAGRLIGEVAEMSRRCAALETVDRLTGLPSHTAFQEHLTREFRRAERYGRPLALILVDLDRFRSFNEAYGHNIGDRLLQEVAIGLKMTVRSVDMAARFGGGQFALLLPETDPAAGLAVAERCRALVEERGRAVPDAAALADHAREAGAEPRRVTASVGMAHYPGEETATRGTLLSSAEAALRRAKDEGRNRVSHLPPPQSAPARKQAPGGSTEWSS